MLESANRSHPSVIGAHEQAERGFLSPQTAAAVVEAVTRCLRVAGQTNEAIARISDELKETRNTAYPNWGTDMAREPAYVVRTGNDSSGPFPVEKIKELRRRGAIDDDTPVALAGRNEWKRTCEVIGV